MSSLADAVPAAIDVVVITIGREAEVNECIDSVLAQDHPRFQLWVLDQGSEAGVMERLRKRAARDGFEFRAIGPVGVAAGRNLGYRLGEAPLIVSLDNDAVFSDPTMLSQVAQAFPNKPGLGAISFAVHDYTTGGPDMGCWVFPWPVGSHFNQRFKAARFCGGAHAITREAFEATGGYDEVLYFFGEEIDLAFALISQGYTIEYQPSVAIRHMASAEGRIDWANGRYYHNVRNMLYLNHKYFNSRLLQAQYLLGFVIRGLVNRMPGQTWRGIRDGLALCRRYQPGRPMPEPALAYINEFELRPRGGLWRRLRNEVLHPLQTTRHE